MRKTLLYAAFLIVAIIVSLLALAPGQIESRLNRVLPVPPVAVSDAALRLHRSLTVVDLHADPLLWNRDLLQRAARGHIDVPRLRDGGVALQVFDAVTKVPTNQNYDGNDSNSDIITTLALVQMWPPRTWGSLKERALYQAAKLNDVAQRSGDSFRIVRSQADLDELLARRQSDRNVVGGLLGIEGLHCLEGQLSNVDALFDAGFRIMGPTHFFDNELGGSAHGVGKGGLTAFGRQVVQRLEERGITIDLAHSSPQLIDDVLAMATRPLIVSHTGVKATCDHIRNLSDDHLRAVARSGGVIGIGYWDAAVCDVSAKGIVRAIRHAVDVAGIDHVGLGSDFDGSTETPFDTTGLPQITAELMNAGYGADEIAKIMGGNAVRVLHHNLPSS